MTATSTLTQLLNYEGGFRVEVRHLYWLSAPVSGVGSSDTRIAPCCPRGHPVNTSTRLHSTFCTDSSLPSVSGILTVA